MPLGDFCAIYLPYCIQRLEDGSWVVLNRQYKPVGFNTRDHIDYVDYPVSTHFKGIGPAALKKIAYDGESEGDRIYLYNDGSNPLRGPSQMEAYLQRIEILAKLVVAGD